MNLKQRLLIYVLQIAFSLPVSAFNLPAYKPTYRQAGNSYKYPSKNHSSTIYTGQNGSFSHIKAENNFPTHKHSNSADYQSKCITLSDDYRQTNIMLNTVSSPINAALINAANRKPFQADEELAPAVDQLGQRELTEDDPGFPGDPGQMPLTDGTLFLLGAVAMYALIKRKINDLT